MRIISYYKILYMEKEESKPDLTLTKHFIEDLNIGGGKEIPPAVISELENAKEFNLKDSEGNTIKEL